MEVRHIDGQDDVRGLIRAHGLAWREAYDGLLPADVLQAQSVDPTDEEIERWSDGLHDNHEGVLVAVEDERVRGFADFRWGDAETKAFVGTDEADLKAIYVDPEYWGEGVGTALLDRGLEILPEWIVTLKLEMFAENDVGRRFYESKGFEQTETGELEIAGSSYRTHIYSMEL